MTAEKVYYLMWLVALVVGTIACYITIKISEMKFTQYEKDCLLKSTISFLESRLIGSAKDIAISDFWELKRVEEKMDESKESQEERILNQEANYMLKLIKQIKNDYRFILNSDARKYLSAQKRFANKCLK